MAKTKKPTTKELVIIKWKETEDIAGTFSGIIENRYGKLLKLETDRAFIGVPLNTVLRNKLKPNIDKLQIGSLVEIHNKGKVKNYYDFDVFIDSVELKSERLHTDNLADII